MIVMADNVVHQIELPDGAGTVVLYDPDKINVRDGRNLMLIHAGKVKWQATPPGGWTDSFISLSIEDGTITAHTWSGYKVGLDALSGEITTKVFTK